MSDNPTNPKRKPAATLRDAPLKATIWKNENAEGAWYSTHFTRTYRNGEGFRDTDGMRTGDLLALARLAERAYDETRRLEDADRKKGGRT